MPKKSELPAEVKTFGRAIRYFREQRGLTLRALARAVNLSAPFVSDIEHDRRSTTHLDVFAKALGVTKADLEKFQLTNDLKDWLGANPDMLSLLRQIRASGTSPEELRSALSKSRR